MEIVSEKVLYEQGCFRTVEQYIKGAHPELCDGKINFLTRGWQGETQTYVIKDIITPVKQFRILDGNGNGNGHDGR
jgi:hypothetical protein